MKANEAPEKIYLTKNLLGELRDGWDALPSDVFSNIEFIRKDAFIEKAEKFFTEKFEVEDYNDNIDVDCSPIFNYCRFIEDFKKYMEE